jgi:two-component system, sensor histidine kinase and response regulator
MRSSLPTKAASPSRHRPKAEVIEFEIADTGAAIAEDKLPIIFERFKQADSSITRKYGGVGLGLYIAKKFIQMLGASIAVQSKLGEGSTFTVALPVRTVTNCGFGADEGYKCRAA